MGVACALLRVLLLVNNSPPSLKLCYVHTCINLNIFFEHLRGRFALCHRLTEFEGMREEGKEGRQALSQEQDDYVVNLLQKEYDKLSKAI